MPPSRGASPAPPPAFPDPPVKLALAATVVLAAATLRWCEGHADTCGQGSWSSPPPLVASALLGGLGCALTLWLIPELESLLVEARLYGIDLNKPTTLRNAKGELVRPIQGVKVPEPMGLVTGTVYLLLMFTFIPFAFVHQTSEHNLFKLTEFITGLLTITCMLFLGFGDDVLNLKWRHKFIMPIAATLPMLLVYASGPGGVTTVTVPPFLQDVLGVQLIELGLLYYIFMLCLAVFSTNAINILAGVNGLEVGQSVVIAMSIVANNVVQLTRLEGNLEERRWNHLFSIYILLPFIGTSLALMYHNWCPSRVFVGDTYCYFAGMTFAVSGILGHNPKTILLFMVPQVLNFLYSLPQLFHLIPCPRHRMPAYVMATGEICTSYAEFSPAELKPLGQLVFKLCKTFHLCGIEELPGGKVKMTNMTVIAFTLWICGPMKEAGLTVRLLGLQLTCTVLAFLIRYRLAGVFYDVVE